MFLSYFAEQRIDSRDGIHFVAPKFNAIGLVLIAWIDFDDVAPDAETAALEVYVVSFVLKLHQLLQKRIARDAHAGLKKDQHAVIGVRVSQAVDAGHAGYDNHVASFK